MNSVQQPQQKLLSVVLGIPPVLQCTLGHGILQIKIKNQNQNKEYNISKSTFAVTEGNIEDL